MHDEFSQNTGPMFDAMTTFTHFRQLANGQLIASSAATPAKQTQPPPAPVLPECRASAVSSSALLRHFAHALWSERIRRTSKQMHLGRGGDFDVNWNRLVTLCCPSDSERVALGLTTAETDCSCLPKIPTPTASDWKGGTAKTHPKSSRQLFRHYWARQTGTPYAPCQVYEAAQGFPITWTELNAAATPLSQQSPTGLADAS